MLNTQPKSNSGTEVVFIGESTPLRTLRTWARGSGLTVTSEPVAGALCVVADETVLHGRCDQRGRQRLARSRELGLDCLPPLLARERLLATIGMMSDRAEREFGSGSIYRSGNV